MSIDQEIKELLSRKERQKNVHDILNSLDPDKHNYNTMLLGFTDIIQSTFYNYAKAQCESQSELKRLHRRINESVNKVIDALEENDTTAHEDMLILATVMIEAINKALLRQQEIGTFPVKKTIT